MDDMDDETTLDETGAAELKLTLLVFTNDDELTPPVCAVKLLPEAPPPPPPQALKPIIDTKTQV